MILYYADKMHIDPELKISSEIKLILSEKATKFQNNIPYFFTSVLGSAGKKKKDGRFFFKFFGLFKEN